MKHHVIMIALTLCTACGDSEQAPEEPEESPTVDEVMASYFAVFDSYDTPRIEALFSSEVTADITGLGHLEGFDAVRDAWLAPFTSAFPDYTHTVNTLMVSDNRATVDFVFTGTHQGELLGMAPTGNQLVLPIDGTYDIENEVVVSFTLEYDVNTVVAAITPAR